jgi:hypothetical protein
MRRKPEYASVPVILVSAWADEAMNLRLAQAFVPKPVDFAELLSTIEHFTSPRQRHDEVWAH